MNVSHGIVLWIALVFFVILVGVALAHVIQGFRFANNDEHILSATLTFMIVFVVISGVTILMIRTVDWGGAWSVSIPTLTETTEQ